MAGSLKVHHWDAQSLDGEAAHHADDIIVEGSDAEDSLSTKAERRRRREAIGRRYLEGHIPFIQSASLHGPFEPESGWENPWDRRQKYELGPQPLKPTRPRNKSKRRTAPLEERESETVCSDIKTLALAECELSGKHPDGYTGIYDAENGDNIFEETDPGGYTKYQDDGIKAKFHAESLSYYGNALQLGDGGNDMLNVSQEDLERSLQRSVERTSGGITAAPTQDRKKRNADTSWLKGIHVLKRSRYEILEHSSPTPAAGTGRPVSPQTATHSSPPAGFTTAQNRLDAHRAETIDKMHPSSINVIMPSSIARKLSERDHLADHNIGTDESWSIGQREQPGGNETIRKFICEEIAFNNLQLEDVQTLSKASHLAVLGANSSAPPQIIKRWQLEIAELSSSDPNGEETTSLTEVRRSYDGAVVATNELNTQDLNGPSLKANHTINSPRSLSPGSEGSFQYQRRNRKSKRKKRYPKPQNIAIVEKGREELGNQTELQRLEYAEDTHKSLVVTQDSPTREQSFDAGDEGVVLGATTEIYVEQLGNFSRNRNSHDGELDREAVTGNVSSPDPLSEDNLEHHKTQASLAGSSNRLTTSTSKRLPTSSGSAGWGGGMTSKADSNIHEEQSDFRRSQSAYAIVDDAQQQLISSSSGCPSDSCNLGKLEDIPSGGTPRGKVDALLEQPDTVRQSPWMDAGVDGLQSAFSAGSSPNATENGQSHDDTEMHSYITVTNDAIPDTQSGQVQQIALVRKLTDAEYATLSHPQSSRTECQEINHTTTQHLEPFPSTQVLIDAATANPWNSSLKKSRSRNSIKRVSFGPLPSDNLDGNLSQPASKATQRLESPPPPEGALRLTHLDDGFHYQLRATKNLEIAEESLTKFMNTPWEQIPAMKPRAKPPPNSPAVDAMAEAFIAADRENLSKSTDMSRSPKLNKAAMEKTDRIVASESWSRPASERHETRSYSPLNASSFSIDPNGKLTAVNFGTEAFDNEDNLDAMIDDVGSFFKGWDVDSELKKAKAPRFEKNGSREHLSGISNR